MADAAEKPVGRPMKFPYTFTAKFVQFPWKYYIKNQWIYRYYGISLILCLPLFNSIRKLSQFFNSDNYMILFRFFTANSPANVAKWAEIRRKELEGHH